VQSVGIIVNLAMEKEDLFSNID